jgi:two-component system response regulator
MKAYNILIADDDPDNFEIARGAFDTLEVKNNLFHVMDGEALITFLRKTLLLKNRLPDIIILDVNMPRLDGLEALKIIKAHKQLKRLPVLVYTSSLCDAQLKKCTSFGADAYVCKHSHFNEVVSFAKGIYSYLSCEGDLPGRLNNKHDYNYS